MKITITIALSLIVLVAFSGAGFAAPIQPNLTLGFIPLGNTTYAPSSGDLFGATSITIPVTETVNTVPCSYLGATNDFANTPECPTAGPTPVPEGTAITFNSNTLNLTFASLPIITWGGEFTFTATSGVRANQTVGNSETSTVYYLGTLTDSKSNYVTSTASLSIAFTQTGGNTGSVNFSATLADPPAPNPVTPEPATLIMFGTAFVGLGLLGRRRKA